MQKRAGNARDKDECRNENELHSSRVRQWLDGLSIPERVSCLAVEDKDFVKLMLNMYKTQQHRGPGFFEGMRFVWGGGFVRPVSSFCLAVQFSVQQLCSISHVCRSTIRSARLFLSHFSLCAVNSVDSSSSNPTRSVMDILRSAEFKGGENTPSIDALRSIVQGASDRKHSHSATALRVKNVLNRLNSVSVLPFSSEAHRRSRSSNHDRCRAAGGPGGKYTQLRLHRHEHHTCTDCVPIWRVNLGAATLAPLSTCQSTCTSQSRHRRSYSAPSSPCLCPDLEIYSGRGVHAHHHSHSRHSRGRLSVWASSAASTGCSVDDTSLSIGNGNTFPPPDAAALTRRTSFFGRSDGNLLSTGTANDTSSDGSQGSPPDDHTHTSSVASTPLRCGSQSFRSIHLRSSYPETTQGDQPFFFQSFAATEQYFHDPLPEHVVRFERVFESCLRLSDTREYCDTVTVCSDIFSPSDRYYGGRESSTFSSSSSSSSSCSSSHCRGHSLAPVTVKDKVCCLCGAEVTSRCSHPLPSASKLTSSSATAHAASALSTAPSCLSSGLTNPHFSRTPSSSSSSSSSGSISTPHVRNRLSCGCVVAASPFFRMMHAVTRGGFLQSPVRVEWQAETRAWRWQEPAWFTAVSALPMQPIFTFASYIAHRLEMVSLLFFFLFFSFLFFSFLFFSFLFLSFCAFSLLLLSFDLLLFFFRFVTGEKTHFCLCFS